MEDLPGDLLLEFLDLGLVGDVLGVRLRGLGVRDRILLVRIVSLDTILWCWVGRRTLLNQSDISDRLEKSLSSCCCISRAAYDIS